MSCPDCRLQTTDKGMTSAEQSNVILARVTISCQGTTRWTEDQCLLVPRHTILIPTVSTINHKTSLLDLILQDETFVGQDLGTEA